MKRDIAAPWYANECPQPKPLVIGKLVEADIRDHIKALEKLFTPSFNERKELIGLRALMKSMRPDDE